jgi:hypothetical protein
MATAKHWNGMSKNDQNTCLETPDTQMPGWDTLLLWNVKYTTDL